MLNSKSYRLFGLLLFLLACHPVLATPTVALGTTVRLAYTKGVGAGGAQVVTVTSTNPTQLVWVDPDTVPNWLDIVANGTTLTTNASAAVLNGTTSAANILKFAFVATDAAALKAAGTYNASIKIYENGSTTALSLPVVLTVSGTSSQVVLSTTTYAWNPADGSLTVPVVVYSTDQPIAFSAALGNFAGNLHGIASPCSLPANPPLMALYMGAALTITCTQNFAFALQIGDSWTMDLTLTPGGVQHLTVNVLAGQPAITSFEPGALAIPTSGGPATVPLTINGANFVAGPAGQTTQVFADFTGDTFNAPGYRQLNITNYPALSVKVLTSNAMLVQIPSTFLQQASAADTLKITLMNPKVASISTSTDQYSPTAPALPVTNAPIVSSIINAASFDVGAAIPQAVPYELISIFGDNFGPNATDPTPTVGAPIATNYYSFPRTLTASNNTITKVSFFRGTTWLMDAPLIFVTKTQINAQVPYEVTQATTKDTCTVGSATISPCVKVVVSTTTGTATLTGDSKPMQVATANPGVFTLNSSGKGQAAALVGNAVNNAANPADVGTGVVVVYLTGLGVPNSRGADLTGSYPAGCNSIAQFLATINAFTDPLPQTWDKATGWKTPTKAPGLWTNVDGSVIMSSYLTGTLPPCFDTKDFAGSAKTSTSPAQPAVAGVPIHVSIGMTDATANINYVGFAPDSMSGLYQLNVQMPLSVKDVNGTPVASGSNTIVDVPFQVTVGPFKKDTTNTSWPSQDGVTISVHVP